MPHQQATGECSATVDQCIESIREVTSVREELVAIRRRRRSYVRRPGTVRPQSDSGRVRISRSGGERTAMSAATAKTTITATSVH